MAADSHKLSQEDLEQGQFLDQWKPQSQDVPRAEKTNERKSSGKSINKMICRSVRTPFSPNTGYKRSLTQDAGDWPGRDISGEMLKGEEEEDNGGEKGEPSDRELKANTLNAPEQRLILVALRLAILEKAASGLGVIAFVWATVVLLGGFVGTLSTYDFQLISALLLTEGTRVFSRGQEIEWQHAASKSFSLLKTIQKASTVVYQRSSDVLNQSAGVLRCCFGKYSHKPSRPRRGSEAKKQPARQVRKIRSKNPLLALKRTWSWSSIPLIPYSALFDARTVSKMLYLLQLASAIVSAGFSLTSLIKQNYGGDSSDPAMRNRNFSLNIFYGLALAEAAIFLFERAYWEYKIRLKKLLKQINDQCKFGDEHLEIMNLFFYDVYSKCLSGSLFDCLDMDLVQYAIAKTLSSNGNEQLGGVRMLSGFVTEESAAVHTLRTIGTTLGAVDRLMEMITWKSEHERQVRTAAAFIITRLVKNRNNCYRVVSMPGALDAVVSLLIDEEHESKSDESFSAANDLKLLGLKILKDLANNRSNLMQIGNTRGLLHILISSIEVKAADEFRNADEEMELKAFKKSLHLLRQLATSTGSSGEYLRAQISKSVFALRYLRDILEYGSAHTVLQEYSVDILASMALDGKMREQIGRTGGIIRNLLALFLTNKVEEGTQKFSLSLKAGEALHLLVVQSPENCSRMIYIDDASSREGSSKTLCDLTGMLRGIPQQKTRAANILRSLCAYLDETAKQEIAAALPSVLRAAMETKGKQQEAFLGLAAYIIPLVHGAELRKIFTEDFEISSMVQKFMSFAPYLLSSTHLPRIRRHYVELANALMQQDSFFIDAFRKRSLRTHLTMILDTMFDLENYYTYSGSVGLTAHSQTIEELVRISLRLLQTI